MNCNIFVETDLLKTLFSVRAINIVSELYIQNVNYLKLQITEYKLILFIIGLAS